MRDAEERTLAAAPENAASETEKVVEEMAVEGETPVVETPAEVEKSEDDTDTSVPEAESFESAEDSKNFHSLSREDLLAELRKIVDSNSAESHKEVTAIKQAYYSVRNREVESELAAFIEAGNPADAFVSTPDSVEAEFKELLNLFKERRMAFLEAIEMMRKENLEKKNEVLARMQSIVDDIDTVNLNFQKFQQLQQEFKNIKEVPESAETEVWKKYQSIVEQFYDLLKMNKELRDLDFKKNLELKNGIIAEAKALQEEPDVLTAFRKLQDLHLRWREIGPVAKDLRESIWDEFKALSTEVRKRHQEYFEEKKAREQRNEDEKTKLCEEIEQIDIESIKGVGEWEKTTKTIMDLQAKWKTLGYATRKANNTLFARFRKKCDEFFGAKAEFYKKMRENFSENLRQKTELCEKAESLKETVTDLKKGVEEALKLQADWKKIGPVARKHSDAIWQRFSAAINYFFDERKKQASATRKEENANLEVKRQIVEDLKAISPDTDRESAVAKVKELQAKWQQTGFVPYKHKEKLQEEYRLVVKNLYDTFDIRGVKARMNRFESQIDELKGNEGKLNRERDRLIRAYEQKKGELKTYENNLGFFNIKSSAGNSMLQEMERRIASIKQELAEIEKKIAILDEASC